MDTSARVLGASGLEVSRLALGSWRTFERLDRDQGLAVMLAARDAGITFLDDARYDDETGTAPLATGYSEVVFGELFRAAGWRRDEVVVANKLWWEFWPKQSARDEIDGSLGRMRLDYLDLIYSEVPPEGLEVGEVVHAAAELIDAGKARAWGVLNWPPELVAAAAEVAGAESLPPPCAAQLPYNLVLRDAVEAPEARAALVACGARVVASMTLYYGALTAKYARAGVSGRIAERLDDERIRRAVEAAEPLARLAAELETTPAALAIAFALANEDVASVLFGATRPEQVAENVGALAVLPRLDDDALARLRSIS